MLKKRSFCVLSLICFLLSACVSEKRYLEVQADLADTQEQIEQENKRLKEIELRFQESEKIRKKCLKDLSVLQARNADLENENLSLLRKIKTLKLNVKKKDSIIQLQEKVVRLLDDSKKTIETSLREQIATKLVEIESMEDEFKVTLTDKILFDLGSAKITAKGKERLLELADSIKENRDQNIVVEGHTDNIPVGSALKKKFPTNWELSAARAVSVVRFLHEEAGLEPERLSACGCSYYRPITSNNTEDGRQKNRRIEIIFNPLN